MAEYEWVSTRDRLPDHEHMVLFVFYGMGDFHEAAGVLKGDYWRNCGVKIPNRQVKYWMDYPSLPVDSSG